MDSISPLSSLTGITGMTGLDALQALYKTKPEKAPIAVESEVDGDKSFSTILDSAMGLLKDTNTTVNKAENEALKFELGYTDNTHDMMIAAQKAGIALQYTTAIRDRFLESYNTLMNMQF